VFHHIDDEYADARSIQKDTGRRIRNYKQIAYMGFELEVECMGDNRDLRRGAELINERWSGIAYLKSDGSLHSGFEIVTHPMTLGYAMSKMKWDALGDLQAEAFDGWSTSTAGLHVHVSRDGFESELHQAKFVNFIHRNEEFMSYLAGRNSSQWASFSKEQLHGISGKIKRRHSSERYMAVNLNNPGTLEVRIFRSSLKPERIQMALQLVDAIVNYTQGLSVSDMVSGKGFNALTFASWVDSKPEYAVLKEYIDNWRVSVQTNSTRIGE
jgi:hypothetical protein